MVTLEKLKTIALRMQGLSVQGASQDGNTHPFDERNIHTEVSNVSKALFDDGHFSQAVFEAYKLVDKEVERLSGLKETGRTL